MNIPWAALLKAELQMFQLRWRCLRRLHDSRSLALLIVLWFRRRLFLLLNSCQIKIHIFLFFSTWTLDLLHDAPWVRKLVRTVVSFPVYVGANAFAMWRRGLRFAREGFFGSPL